MSIRKYQRLFREAYGLASKYPLAKRMMVFKDFLSLYRRKGINAEEYYDFQLENQNEDFRRSFLGLNEQRYYLDYLNPIKYYSLSRNKYLAHKVLKKTGVRTAEMYCYYQPEGVYYDSDECAGDLQSVLRILKSKEVSECVIKTTESSHGDNVWVIKSVSYTDNDAELIRFDGQEVLLSELLRKAPLVFEEVVNQTAQFSAFNESSVNTIRFMTTLFPDGSARAIACFFKIGRAGRCVDNAGSGGNVDTSVDLETGEIKYPVQFDGWRRIKEVDVHPDSGAQINGVIINNWEAIKEKVIKYQQAFPFCKAAGWDIAITDEGPVVIEVNDFWDRTGQAFIRRGWRKEIRDCYLAWKKTGAKYNLYRQQNVLDARHLRKIISHD